VDQEESPSTPRRRDLIALLGSAIIGWPFGAAQQGAMPVIGYLSPGSPESDAFRLTGFRQGLNETGYVEGQNVTIEYRWAQGQYDRLPALAADLVRRQVTVIATAGIPPTFAAKAATSTIPIAFLVGVDPVQSSLIDSLNRPGGNMTGVAILSAELAGKRLDLLRELVPTAAVIVLLFNPASPEATETETSDLQGAAHSLGLQLRRVPASTASEIDTAFGTIVELRAGALIVSTDPFFTNQRAQIVALAARHAVPATYAWREYAAAGGLMSYGADIPDSYRLSGIYTGKILKGTKPADLPIQRVAEKIKLVINLKTAKALGLTIPQSLLARADEVIE
jgi:putative tryptophan/tyrosine transport system substrate-binding protein